MVTEIVKRNRELEEENRKLRDSRCAIEEECGSLKKRLERSEAERRLLELRIEQLKHLLFGRRSEKIGPQQLEGVQADLFGEAKKQIEDERESIVTERRRRRNGRQPIPKELPRERVVLDVDPEIRTCAGCRGEMRRIGEDVTEELEYIPASLHVVEYVRPKYVCPECQDGVLMEPLPRRPIKKGRPGPGLLAHVIVSKYGDHLPLHRQERIFERHGFAIQRSTLCDWVQATALLLEPIVKVMKRDLVGGQFLQADETPVSVRDPTVRGKTVRGYIWSYGIPWQETVYDFTLGRSGGGPEAFLGGFRGHLQTDAYSGYNAVLRREGVESIGCWAHVRRKFFEAREESPKFSELVLASTQKLYRIERRAKEEGIRGEALVELRRTESRPMLEGIKEVLELEAPRVLPKSGLGVAIQYALSQWPALVRYVDVPEAEIDNNSCENGLRGVVLGRKNWLFVGHPRAGPRAAVLLSLIETCRRLKAEPWKYFRDVIEAMAKDPSRAEELTPRCWLEARRGEEAENSPRPSDG